MLIFREIKIIIISRVIKKRLSIPKYIVERGFNNSLNFN